MKSNSIVKTISVILICTSLFYSCGNDETNLKVDISGIKVELKVHRFDKALFEIVPDSMSSNIPKFENEFGEFFNLFCSRIINIGNKNSRDFEMLLQKYVTDYNMLTVYDDCKNSFHDVSEITNNLTTGFKYYKSYFPEKNIPEIYFFMGGFNQSIVTSDNILGIGLERYLGKNYPYYSKLGLASYQSYKMQKEFIVPDCFRAIAWSEFPFNDSIDDLIHNIIYQGKVQYYMNAMLPDVADTLKFAYTKSQWDWCLANEQLMWSYLIDNKQFFISGEMDIKRYIDDAPFTTMFPRESPGRIGVWIGWRIVNKYMNNHPEISLQQLMLESNYEIILDGSKYNP